MLSGGTITGTQEIRSCTFRIFALALLNRSLNDSCAHIKSFSSPFAAFLCPPPILSHTLFLNLPFCLCPPCTCSRCTEDRSALEQLYFLLACSFPSPAPAEGKVHASSACLVLHSTWKDALPERVPLQRHCHPPPAFTEGQGSQARHAVGNTQKPNTPRGPLLFHTAPWASAPKLGLEELTHRRNRGKSRKRAKKGVNK